MPSTGLRPEPVLPVTPLTNNVGFAIPSFSSGTEASRMAVAKQPGCPMCGVGEVARCSGTAQVNCDSRDGAPWACLYTAA